MENLKWGIVSAGRICEQFVSDMKFVQGAKVQAVAARNIEHAKEFANKHDIEKHYGGYQALFDDPEVDVVYIGTPHTAHFQQCYDAICAGKHVVCEKPLVVSPKECTDLIEHAKQHNVYFMEAMWTYFLPAIKQARTWVDEGKIGEIKHVKADFGYPLPYDPTRREYDKDLAGGCLLEMGIYPLAIASYFLGENINDWFVSSHLADNGVEDDVLMIGHCGQAKATLATSFQCKLNNYAYIIGDKGYIALHDFWRANCAQLFVLEEEVERFVDDRESLGFDFEAQAVVDDIRQGKRESNIVPHSRSLWLQEKMAAIKARF